MSLASVATHAHPPFPLPAVPRVRPPPIPKGTPGPNTKPIPAERPKVGVWADGRFRDPKSSSAKHKSEVVSRQLEKALRHEVQGMHIYAYRHFSTNQVVYSLTKNMVNNRILKQLVFHGKQTVPRALRRDMWRPYFSIHFPKTPAGAAKGLQVYKELRELSLRRQLKPPPDMVIATQQDIDNIKRKYTPVALRDAMEVDLTKRGTKYVKVDMPVVGMRLPKKMIAGRLMNQRATSVADVAAVLKRHVMPRSPSEQKHSDGADPQSSLTPKQRLDMADASRKARKQGLSSRAFDRLEKIEQTQAEKVKELESRREYVKVRGGHAGLQKHTEDRISMEYEGLVRIPEDAMVLNLIDEAQAATEEEAGYKMSLQATLEQIEEEKETQRTTIEKEISAQIDQRLADMTESERTHIQKGIAEERTRREADLEAKIAEAESKLRTNLEKVHSNFGGLKSKAALAEYRRIKRNSTAAITIMKIDEQQKLKWLGPYAEINDHIGKAFADIDALWGESVDTLRKEVAEEKVKGEDTAGHEVEIRWADIRDGTYAREWPDSVYHGDLQPMAVVKTQKRIIREYAHVDEEDYEISQQYSTVQVPAGTSVHVFGAEEVEDPSKARWQSPIYLNSQASAQRKDRTSVWTEHEIILVYRHIITLRAKNARLNDQLDEFDVDKDRMPNTASVMENFNSAVAWHRSIKPDDYRLDQKNYRESVDNTLTYLDRATDNDLIQNARLEIGSCKNPTAAQARLDWVLNCIDQTRLECTYPEAKAQADLRDIYVGKIDERLLLLTNVAEDESSADLRLQHFDQEFPHAKELMQKYNANPKVLNALLLGTGNQRQSQQEQIQQLEKAVAEATAARAAAEAQHPAINGEDAPLVIEKDKLLQDAVSELQAAEEQQAQDRAHRMEIVDQIRKLIPAMKEDRASWVAFRNTRGELEMIDEGDIDDVVVPEQRKGIWGRVKGLFGRT